MKMISFPQWDRYDALILYCIPEAGTDLRNLLAYFDSIDHSVPTLQEFNMTIRRLRGSGLIVNDEKRWRLTPEAVERMTRFAFRSRGGIQAQVDDWLRFLKTVPLTADNGPNLRLATYQKGVQAYHQWVEEVLTTSTKRHRSAT